jgi:CBS domain-containing protein/sporulation protein YlmC with PRC-barrel domain
MTAFTEFLGKPIRDPDGEAVASLHDLVVRIDATDAGDATPDGEGTPEMFPPVIGLVARVKSPSGPRDVFIPWEHITGLNTKGAQLSSPVMNLLRFTRREGEIVLREGLFDKQLVDVEGRRVVRVNDLDLAQQPDGSWALVGVDISPGALLRRVGMMRLSKRIGKPALISWAQVIPVADKRADEGAALRLRVPRDKLALVPPADLARMVEQLTPQQGADLLTDLDEAQVADTIEELEDEQQGQLLRAMDPERAADVLEEMEPDEATDALQSVSDEEAADLLKRMSKEDADEVQELLGYPEDSAGGLMTTYYVSIPDWATAGEARVALRNQARAAAADEDDPLPDALSEIFVVADGAPALPKKSSRPNGGRPRNGARTLAPDAGANGHEGRTVSVWSEGRLVGVVTLRDLLLADQNTPIADVMTKPRRVGHPLDDQRDAARIIAEDDLLALPIVDEQGGLLGVVSVDDAIDVILPPAWKKRIPRVYR